MATNIFPESSGASLVMSSASTVIAGDVHIKTALATLESAGSAGFWTAIDLSHTLLGWESVKLAAAADTTEQTIVDTTGAGVLTHVLSPELSGSGTVTIRVTRDGELFTFVSETIGTGARFMVGDFKGWTPTVSTADGIGHGSGNDVGYAVTTLPTHMTTPLQAVVDTRNGIKFKSTLKVTIQGSVNISGSAELLNAAACYTLALPEGL